MVIEDGSLIEGYWNGDNLLGLFVLLKPNGDVFIGENFKGGL